MKHEYMTALYGTNHTVPCLCTIICVLCQFLKTYCAVYSHKGYMTSKHFPHYRTPVDSLQIGPVRRSLDIFICRLKQTVEKTNKQTNTNHADDYNGLDDHGTSMSDPTCYDEYHLKTLTLWNACRIYFVECVSTIRHILSVIHYTIQWSVCFQLTHFPCDDCENIYTLSYYHHQIGSANYYPLFRVRSWSNGGRCVSFCILLFYMDT